MTPRAGTLGNGMRQKLWLLVTGLSALRLLQAAQDASSVARLEALPSLPKTFQVIKRYDFSVKPFDDLDGKMWKDVVGYFSCFHFVAKNKATVMGRPSQDKVHCSRS